MYVLYSLLIVIFGVLASPYLAYQALRYKKYIGSLGQRMGYLPVSFNLDGEDSIWIHAVSVGEALTVRALIADLNGDIRRCGSFCRRRRWPGSRSRVEMCRTSMPCSIFRSISSFIVRRTLRLVTTADFHHDGNRDLAEPSPPV